MKFRVESRVVIRHTIEVYVGDDLEFDRSAAAHRARELASQVIKQNFNSATSVVHDIEVYKVNLLENV